MRKLFSTHDLSIGFPAPNLVLFEQLNLTLNEGELVCFMGRNGIGKSSLLRTIAGLQKSIAGKTEICGVQSAADLPKQIAIVLAEAAQTGMMTVSELVAFGRYPYLDWKARLTDIDTNRITEILGQLGIAHLADRQISHLSDGQRQMTFIARALAQDTPIILLDEPTSHLDLNHRVEVMRILKSLCRNQKKGVVIASHELDLALQTADTIWLAGNNRNILTGLPEDLVLAGAFDEVFQFKGFDLKTGRLSHDKLFSTSISLKGTGFELLWTKNALERTGFEVTQDNATPLSIEIVPGETTLFWQISYGQRQYKTTSIRELLEIVFSIVCTIPE